MRVVWPYFLCAVLVVLAGILLGSLAATSVNVNLAPEQVLEYGWRLPFLASAVLVFVGLWVRLKITETPEFQTAMDRKERVKAPAVTLFGQHKAALFLGTFSGVTTFTLFYLMTVFALGWATTGMGLARADVLPVQLIGVLFFAALIPVTALAADKFGQVRVLIASTIGIGLFGALFAPLLHGGLSGLLIFFALGFALMGCTYGPLGAAMARPFPTAVRYTGALPVFVDVEAATGNIDPSRVEAAITPRTPSITSRVAESFRITPRAPRFTAFSSSRRSRAAVSTMTRSSLGSSSSSNHRPS